MHSILIKIDITFLREFVSKIVKISVNFCTNLVKNLLMHVSTSYRPRRPHGVGQRRTLADRLAHPGEGPYRARDRRGVIVMVKGHGGLGMEEGLETRRVLDALRDLQRRPDDVKGAGRRGC